MPRARLDLGAAIAAVLALAGLVAYLVVIAEQGDEGPAVWFVVGLVAGIAAAAYGAVVAAPRRRAALLGAGIVLGVLGLLGILTIGLPILLAGALALGAALRTPR